MESDNSMVGSVEAGIREIMDRLENAEGDHELRSLLQTAGKDDFALIGELVQTYCVADALCRGVTAMLQEHRLGTPSPTAYSLNDTDVLRHLKTEAELTGAAVNKAGIISAVETIELHRVFRHTFSHWVVHRYMDGRHFVALSKSARDAKKRDDIALQYGEAKLMVFPIDDLKSELAKIKHQCKFLTEVHAYLEGTSATSA